MARENRGKLTPALANKSLADACLDVECDGRPSEFDDAHEGASYARVMGIECTKSLFQCGSARDNVCWINKVADRLGVACDPTENKTDSPLIVHATGARVR